MKVEIVDGKPNGEAVLYRNGIVHMSWNMKDGEHEGSVRVYASGKLDKETDWSNIENLPHEIPWFQSKEDGSKVMILKDNQSMQVVYRGECNDEFQRHGYGIEYSRENGEVLYSGSFEGNHLNAYHQLIVTENGKKEMVEYDRDNMCCVDYPSSHPIYKGGFFYDENTHTLLRDGVGQLISPSDGQYQCDCEYEKGKDVTVLEEERNAEKKALIDKIESIQSEVDGMKRETTMALSLNRKVLTEIDELEQTLGLIMSEMELLEDRITRENEKTILGDGYEVLRGIEIINIGNSQYQMESLKVNGASNMFVNLKHANVLC